MIANVKWQVILEGVCDHLEKHLDIVLTIDTDIVNEIQEIAKKTIESFCKEQPNAAKIAGSVAFWIRKLKPVSHDAESPQKYLAINELVGLYVGLAICGMYYDDKTRPDYQRIDERVIQDWAYSMRLHSFSPQSTVTAFEMIAADMTRHRDHPRC